MQIDQQENARKGVALAGDSYSLQPAWERKADIARAFLFGALAVCMLLWVAFYNGYPTVYPDTGAYLYTGAFHIALPPFRAPGYGVFALWTSLGASAWFTAIIQAILVVTVLHETCKYLIGGEEKFRGSCMLAIACVLAALTSLPWEVSLLMPDVFAGVVFLCVFLLAFNSKLRVAERIILGAILAISVGAHMSLLPIAVLFILALAVPRLAGWQAPGAPPARTALAWLLVPIVAAGLWTATLNRKMGLGFHLSVSGNEFLLGRLFGDGLAGDYLREVCPGKPFVACKYLGSLPRTPEQFLFWNPLLHAMDGHGNELNEIVRGTLAAYPFRFVGNSMWNTLRQIRQFRTGDEVRDFALHAQNSNAAVIQEIFPRDFPAFSNSRLIRGRLLRLANAAARLDTAVFWLSASGCLWLAWTRRAEKLNCFLYSTVAFLVINAAICATLAGVYDRYQSRVAWIMPLCFALYVAAWMESKRARIPENAA